MSQAHFKKVIGLLVTDNRFKAEFKADPKSALAARDLQLTDEQIESLLPSSQRTGPVSEVLDDRIKRRSDDMM